MPTFFYLLTQAYPKADNLEAYKKMYPKFKYPDLTQSCKNGRARGETKDGCLPTLTTHTGQLFSQARSSQVCDKKFGSNREEMHHQCLPAKLTCRKACLPGKLQLLLGGLGTFLHAHTHTPNTPRLS